MRLSKTGAACAAILGVMLAVGSADAQEKKVRINIGGRLSELRRRSSEPDSSTSSTR